jgi:hypothetical protein
MAEETTGLWKTLNSPFILFLFSSIVLGGISFLYQEYAAYKKAKENRSSKIARLETEIKYRLDSLAQMIQSQFTYTTLFTAHGAILGESGNKSSKDVLVGEYSAIHPEFSQRSLRSLLWELQDLKKRSDNKIAFDKSIEAARILGVLWNENTQLVEGVESGQHDSIWHFTNSEAQDRFRLNTEVIRDGVFAKRE